MITTTAAREIVTTITADTKYGAEVEINGHTLSGYEWNDGLVMIGCKECGHRLTYNPVKVATAIKKVREHTA